MLGGETRGTGAARTSRRTPVKVLLHLSDFGWPIAPEGLPSLLAEIAALTEEGGFDGIAVADHLWQHRSWAAPSGPARRHM
jgi:alkanesulfonate monooxygenase SsuD/methylene tetrahydromethanopterin reductase-like flavin-dependent oxidoreductase (luciferase family)